jgi:hypothetical protein
MYRFADLRDDAAFRFAQDRLLRFRLAPAASPPRRADRPAASTLFNPHF